MVWPKIQFDGVEGVSVPDIEAEATVRMEIVSSCNFYDLLK